MFDRVAIRVKEWSTGQESISVRHQTRRNHVSLRSRPAKNDNTYIPRAVLPIGANRGEFRENSHRKTSFAESMIRMTGSKQMVDRNERLASPKLKVVSQTYNGNSSGRSIPLKLLVENDEKKTSLV